MDHLSVKPGPKRLNFYGQTAIFDHFVRNRHFWDRPFTDRRLIFIDVSVNAELLSNGVDDLENFTSEMEWSFFVPVGFSCVFSNWYSYVSTPPAFPLAWIHV